MSNRRYAMSNCVIQLVVAVVLMLLTATSTSAAIARIRIDTISNVPLGQFVEVPILLEAVAGARIVSGFDLLIEADEDVFSFNSLIRGDIYTQCQWEYLTYNYIFECDGRCRNQLRLIGIADIGWQPATPTCYGDAAIELARLRYRTPSDNSYACAFQPIRFLWNHCNSNTISSLGDFDTLLVSADVYDYDGTLITDGVSVPSYGGVADSCRGVGNGDTLYVSEIDFVNGGVTFSCVDTVVPTRARITTEFARAVDFGDTVQIAVDFVVSDSTFAFSEFDLLFSYDTAIVTLIDIQPGQLITDCGWDLFDTQINSLADCGGAPCPEGSFRISAKADASGSAPYPSCLADTSGQLALLTFVAGPFSADYECRAVPVDFEWYDCQDNVMIDSTFLDTNFLSNRMFFVETFPVITQSLDFPTVYGSPTECVGGATVRAVDFVAGGFDFLCSDSIDSRGDINLNGISNEVADYVLFTQYFFFGLSVFDVNVDAQVAASDVNNDGLMLTLDDLIYLFRIIIGDAIPFPTPPSSGNNDVVEIVAAPAVPSDFAAIIHDTLNNTISFFYPDSLSAFILNFDGLINTTMNMPFHDGWASHDTVGNKTTVFILPKLIATGSLQKISEGILFSYTGEGELTSVDVAYNGLQPVSNAIFVSNGTTYCCVNRGNADGILSSGVPIDVNDLTYLVSYLFKGGPIPPCEAEGNVDGIISPAGFIDVSDLTYLVAYLFKAGPNPPGC